MALGAWLMAGACGGGSPFPSGLTVIDSDSATSNLNDPLRGDVYGTDYFVVPNQGSGSNRLVVMDISSPAALALEGSLQDNTDLVAARYCTVVGNYAYVGANQRVTIVDLTTPASPSKTGVVSNAALANPEMIAVSGGYAYAAAGAESRLVVVDVSTPASPSVTGSVQDTTNMAFPTCVAYSGGYCFVGDYTNNRITVVDVSTPASPSVSTSLQDNTNLNGPYDIVIDGNFLYVACYKGDRLTIVDISTPTSPSVAGSVTDATNLNGAIGVCKDGDYCYVSCYDADRVTIVDVSNTSSPTLTVNGGVISATDGTAMNGAWGIKKVGNYLFTAANLGDLVASLEIT